MIVVLIWLSVDMVIRNNTHYYNIYSKFYNVVPDIDSFNYESSKRLGYFQRLYFEFEYTKMVNGVAFFYTFTYNDKSIPKYLGRNCFNYEHIRLITNGVLSKRLEREYGSRLRYFCCCESGDGKGVRGKGNNPHYHFIFFIQPLHNKEGKPIYESYKEISPDAFNSICREVWQGSTTWIPWQFARFGHVEPGQNNGVVMNADCLSYVGKYVVKDSAQRDNESYIYQYWTNEYRSKGITNDVLYCYYKYLHDLCLKYSKYDFIQDFAIHEYWLFRHNFPDVNVKYQDYLKNNRTVSKYYKAYDGHLHLFAYNKYIELMDYYRDVYIPMRVEEKMREYKNMYGPKVRCSKSLGLYGLNFIENADTNPIIRIKVNKKYKVYAPSMYYLRKLYYRVIECPVTHNPLYVLNESGIALKKSQLQTKIDTFSNKMKECVSEYLMNDSVSISLDPVVSKFEESPKFNKTHSIDLIHEMYDVGIDSILYLYSVYHYIYRYRHYKDGEFSYLVKDFSFDTLKKDYDFFLRNTFYFIEFDNDITFSLSLRKYNAKSFRSHELFISFMKYFDFLDVLLSDLSKRSSDIRRKVFADKSDHIRKLNQYRFNCSIA